MGWPDIHWLARDLRWAGGSHCLTLDRNLSMPLEPELAPCGWRCPHRRPALTGPSGNCYQQNIVSRDIGPRQTLMYGKQLNAQPCRNYRVCLLAGHLAGHMEDSRMPAYLAPTYNTNSTIHIKPYSGGMLYVSYKALKPPIPASSSNKQKTETKQ